MKLITLIAIVSCGFVSCMRGEKSDLSTPLSEMRNYMVLDSLHLKYYRDYDFRLKKNAIAYANRPLNYFRLGKYSLATSIDSVYSELGEPVVTRKASWFDGDHTGMLFMYSGIYFQYAFGSSSCVQIRTTRPDVMTPDNIHCGMKIDELKSKLHNLTFSDDENGLVVISTPEGFEFIIIYVLNGQVIGLCLQTGAG